MRPGSRSSSSSTRRGSQHDSHQTATAPALTIPGARRCRLPTRRVTGDALQRTVRVRGHLLGSRCRVLAEGRTVNDRCPTCGSRYAQWTPEKLKAAAVEWFNKTGRPPTADDWARATVRNPTRRTVYSHFASWPVFIRECGMTPLSDRVEWTREMVVDAMFRWRYLHGELPRSGEWNTRGLADGFPARSTVRRLFGSWNAGIVAAGYMPRRSLRSAQGYRAVASATSKRVAA
ncbi:hypothetical protein UFOVP1186_10 [uncultured Caudovirales phage]|uniref:Uncharacterized protein n=1 Tax=uncultured Caudovirales phage TaxID=2100421 RepID=A0A6J7XNU7_9CAUD|nr:hypothetical protein UFOVP959_14 [uncultured Caudovirales phage]CAB4189281.1 hypothetical protein UFOVP1186_10 [uncultured Caudovirales phage]CAB4192199.1 hypothetical protein UFOVP1234_9 [uncultured Caudovirales phage]CAB4215509.1 hypothetical protein UFOVP1487_22 [uncultured Caudovirales phage]CAB5238940.1 hypothetical protein UFOVP1574_32 [uncultured Caudovirales phage]